MKRYVTSVLAVAILVGGSPSPGLADRPPPSTVLVKVKSAAGARALLSALRDRPKRIVRLPGGATSLLPISRQVVAVAKRAPAVDLTTVPVCARSPLQIDNVDGAVTPGGTLTIHGSCLGSAKGGADLLGDFPGGALHLAVTAWGDNVVTASVPAVTGVPDLPVRLRLSGISQPVARTALIKGQQVAIAPNPTAIFSDPVSMRFTATRETTTLWATNLENLSCGRGALAPNISADLCFTAAIGYWTLYGNEHSGVHVRPAGSNDAGEDIWRMRVPAGWRFDHIEYQGMSPATNISISPTLDPSNVTWHVMWKTDTRSAEKDTNVIDAGPRNYNVEDGSYLAMVYITGPAGTMKH